MNLNIRKEDKLIMILNNSAVDLATPSNISRLWNFGYMAFLCLMTQIITGLLLTMDYSSQDFLVFSNLAHTMMDMKNGWMIRNIHAAGASLFFIIVYVHISRGMYFNSPTYKKVWLSGVSILLALMATAFLGYVLPWGQMSFWGATVITNLFSVVPVVGTELVQYLWGSFSVSNPSLKRFYSLHFILPFIILFLSILHVFFLHETGSSNPLGVTSNEQKTYFYPYNMYTDAESTFHVLFYMVIVVLLGYLFLMEDPDNFNMANPLMAPPHIQPEWYFLFAYAILRSIPNKMGGVVALLLSVSILYTLPFSTNKKFKSNSFNPATKILLWLLLMSFLILTWIGMKPVETPYILIGQTFSVIYFMFFIINPLVDKK